MTGEIPVLVVPQTIGFDAFYGPARASVVRALSATLRDNDLAIDAADEALARAFQRWDRVGRMDNPEGWVYRVGLNYARNRVRRLLRRRTTPTGPHVFGRGSADVDPDIERALGSLSLDHRAVVVCRLLLDWSEIETAQALAIRPGTVKSRLSRALLKLEHRLEHLRPEQP